MRLMLALTLVGALNGYLAYECLADPDLVALGALALLSSFVCAGMAAALFVGEMR